MTYGSQRQASLYFIRLKQQQPTHDGEMNMKDRKAEFTFQTSPDLHDIKKSPNPRGTPFASFVKMEYLQVLVFFILNPQSNKSGNYCVLIPFWKRHEVHPI